MVIGELKINNYIYHFLLVQANQYYDDLNESLGIILWWT